MEGITIKDDVDFSTMTQGEIYWYLEGKKQGHKEAKDEEYKNFLEAEMKAEAELEKTYHAKDMQQEMDKTNRNNVEPYLPY